MPWDPACCGRFRDERLAPFHDLVVLVEPRAGMRVVDLGCGTGEPTARLAAMLPGSDVLGIDASPEMLAQAMPLERPGLRFRHGRIEDVQGEWDLVFSHAALQWLDGHDALLPKLLALLRPGGRIAVQVPSNHSHPTHLLIAETAAKAPFAAALDGWTRRSPVLPIDAYATLLASAGASDISVCERVYLHTLDGADALVAWVRGTALVPYLERLPERLRGDFLDRYAARVRAAFPGSPVLYPFRRTLFAATAPA